MGSLQEGGRRVRVREDVMRKQRAEKRGPEDITLRALKIDVGGL